MSDLEDEDVILDDIKALQAVLTQERSAPVNKEVKSEYPVSVEPNQYESSADSILPDISPSTSRTFQDLTAVDPLLEAEESDNEYNDENEEDDNGLENLSDPETALNLNRKIIGLLSTAQRRLRLLLEECRRRQLAIDKKIHKRTSDALSRTFLTIAGIPYFKDKQLFPAPQNLDARLKKSRGELQIIDLPYPLRWTLKDRNTLWEAVYFNAKAMWQEESRRKELGEGESSLNISEDPLRLDYNIRARKIPEEMLENMKQLVGPLGSKELDWMKIAATDFNGRHSAIECRAMWNVFLHPDINKGKWKKSEDYGLKSLAEEYNFQDWDSIAARLDTNRSGYQCFIRFNTNFKNNNTFSRSSSWSKEEDQKLTDTVNALRTGNFIPWGEVAKLMGNRRKQQIYMRWNYSLAPNLKKGRFTEEEDKLLLEGVAKFGANFTKISAALLPRRNTAQLNDHYRTLMNEKQNDWNCEDDMKLVRLVDKFGNNWSVIAKEFSNKSRVQVRHRHKAIIRYLSRGLSIKTLPRWGLKPEENATPDELVTRGEEMLNQMSEMLMTEQTEKETEKREQLPRIDSELRDYFKGIYRTSSKRGRHKKFYSIEELEKKTERINVVLNILNADLDIPDDLEDEPHLTEKNKQLLTSLKIYSEKESIEFEARQKYIEYIRRKMFGASVPSSDMDRFIPPLPFDGRVQKCKRKQLVGLDYHPDGDKCLVELTYELLTPEAIVSLNGGWDSELEFQNMEKIFLGETRKFPRILSPTRTENEIHFEIIDPNAPSTSGTVGKASTSIGEQHVSIANELSDGITNRKLTKYYPEMLIPPNYATLLGFRSILLSKHILEAENPEEDQSPEEECTITPEGRKSLEFFEERLIKLFKFPIELSEIAPPLLHGLQNGEFDDIDGDQCRKKRKASNSSLGPGAKRKTRLEKLIVTESSEAQ